MATFEIQKPPTLRKKEMAFIRETRGMATRWCVYLGGIVPRAGGSGGGGIVPQAGGGGDVVRLVDVGASRVAFAPRVTHFNPPALTTRDSPLHLRPFLQLGVSGWGCRGVWVRGRGCWGIWSVYIHIFFYLGCGWYGLVMTGSW